MTLILNIDTSQEVAIVNLALNGKVIHQLSNAVQKNHATFLHQAIRELILISEINLTSIHAIAVANGPGSYTGLRVGLSSAKGLSYALSIPLITISSLHVLAFDCIVANKNQNALFCPMIDARRLEVFTMLVDEKLQNIITPCAMILDEKSFSKELDSQKIFFCGSGSKKFKPLQHSTNASFETESDLGLSLSNLSFSAYENKKFSNLALVEPDYIKDYQIFNNN